MLQRVKIPIPPSFSTAILLLLSASQAIADDQPVDFARQVLPILSAKCFTCHGPDSSGKSDLRLDSQRAATADLGGYQALTPGDPEKSELIIRIRDQDNPMPPADAERQLTDAERELLTRWIRQGGEYTRHWAYVPPKRAGASMDELIAARFPPGVDFAPEADRPTLARRAALVLTGLPPEPELLRSLLADPSEQGYEQYIDALLASPRYGEHQARYWLDAIRYGDTHGLHLDNRRGIYPYRDWVVRALNRNQPFDQFLTWQLAGDLLPDPGLEQLVATGFVRMNPTTAEGGVIPAEFQAKNNFDRVETLGTALLGTSFVCARCHSHKYDPVSQTEYYELLAFFNSTAESPLDGNSYEYGPTLKVPADIAAWDHWERLMTSRQQLLARVASPPVESAEQWNSLTDSQRLQLLADAKGPLKEHELHDEAGKLAAEIAAAEQRFTTTLVARELPQPRETRLLGRGEYELPVGEPLAPAVPAVMGEFPSDTPLNRLGLARWLTSPDHPLVSRVLVNRFWQQVFGHGLVRTPEEFGLQGEPPTHPELLDWLAGAFRDSGWDLKSTLKLLVTSRTFRQESKWRDGVNDPGNRLYARGPSFRLDAEVLRDVAIWSGDLLDASMGGEGVKPWQPEGLWTALMHPASNTKNYVPDTDGRQYRRSLYVYWKRTSPHPMMTLFDAPSRESSCVRRSRSNTPLQSLGLLNEVQRLEAARALADRLLAEGGAGDQSRLAWLFTLLVCRQPSDIEGQACLKLLSAMRQRYAASPDDARALLAGAESDDLAEHAAWTQVAITLLASDINILLY
ncbi:MAG: PSD1 domain-containing protein [Pirellulaceae bacterium]|nr:PSD1 domain-containing protein [Pirellulaceae bacterium]